MVCKVVIGLSAILATARFNSNGVESFSLALADAIGYAG
jgi:hypothetical protein